jgi:predicted DNA binding protein
MRLPNVNQELGPPFTISLELQSHACEVFQHLAEQNIEQPTLVDIRRLPNGIIRHLIRIPTNKIPSCSLQQFQSINNNHNGHTLAWFDSEDCLACQAIISNNSFQITGASVNKDTIIYNFMVPEHHDFQNIISSLETPALKLRILEMSNGKAKDTLLTNKQERALWFANTFGFFNYPRSITLFNLAQKLGIASSTLSEQLRRGTRRLVENYYYTL